MSESDSGVDTGNESNESNSMSIGSPPPSDEDKEIPFVTKESVRVHNRVERNMDAESNEFFQKTLSQNLCLYNDIGFAEYGQDKYVSKFKRRKTGFSNKHEVIPKLGQIVGERKLRLAANKNDILTVRNLLDAGVNPDGIDLKLRSALHFAAANGYTEVAKLLLERGAKPNLQDIIGNTPLHLAACKSSIKMVTLLLKAGTDINVLDHHGRSPFHLAESKLKLLQMNKEYSSAQLKAEVIQVLEMMQVYLQRSGRSGEDLINAISNRLHHHQTREEVDNDVSDLLSSLSHLSLQTS